MAKRVKTTADVSNVDVLLFNWPGYWRRALRTVGYGLLYVVLIGIVAFITTWVLFATPASIDWANALKGTTGTATGVIQTVDLGPEGVEAVPALDGVPDPAFENFPFGELFFYIYLVEAVLIALLGMVFSGWYAKVFMTPVNPLKFSPFAILHHDRISFRFWVCLPSQVFLYNLSVKLSYSYGNRFDASVVYMNGEGAQCDPTHIQTESFMRLRGVWHVDVPFGTDTSARVLKDFETLAKAGRNPLFCLSIYGETESGEVVAKEARFSRLRMLRGYNFAPYHVRDAKGKETNIPIFGNFAKVCVVDEASGTQSGLSTLQTDPIEAEYVSQFIQQDKVNDEFVRWNQLLDGNSAPAAKLQSEAAFLAAHTGALPAAPTLCDRIRAWRLTIAC